MPRQGQTVIRLGEKDKRVIGKLLETILVTVDTIVDTNGVEKQLLKYQGDWSDVKVLEYFKPAMPHLNLGHVQHYRQQAFGLTQMPAGV